MTKTAKPIKTRVTRTTKPIKAPDTVPSTPRELLRVYAHADGSLEVAVRARWSSDPANKIPARLGKAVAAAIVGVLGGEASVPEFFRLNRPQ